MLVWLECGPMHEEITEVLWTNELHAHGHNISQCQSDDWSIGKLAFYFVYTMAAIFTFSTLVWMAPFSRSMPCNFPVHTPKMRDEHIYVHLSPPLSLALGNYEWIISDWGPSLCLDSEKNLAVLYTPLDNISQGGFISSLAPTFIHPLPSSSNGPWPRHSFSRSLSSSFLTRVAHTADHHLTTFNPRIFT